MDRLFANSGEGVAEEVDCTDERKSTFLELRVAGLVRGRESGVLSLD